jgi:hypothetical protein
MLFYRKYRKNTAKLLHVCMIFADVQIVVGVIPVALRVDTAAMAGLRNAGYCG